jgi:TetR/AcrR family transcriptional regulator, cholesterol catabolism regulator
VAEALDRRQRIIDSAATAFASRGVAATTVRQIADEVGILSGSLYHHFESKEAIVEAIISPYLDELRQRYREALAGAADPPSRLRDLVGASLATAAAHPQATEIYQNEVNYLRGFERFAFLPDVQREVRAAWLGVISAGVATGAFRSDVDPPVFYRLIRDAVWLSVRWFSPSADYPVSRLADQCTAVFLNGLTARPAIPSARRRRSATGSPTP